MSGGRQYRCAPGIVWVADAGSTLLVDRQSGRAWTLTGIDSTLWRWLAAGDGGERVVELLAVMLCVPPADAARRLEQTLERWRVAGLLESTG